jgi:hypothetical protein
VGTCRSPVRHRKHARQSVAWPRKKVRKINTAPRPRATSKKLLMIPKLFDAGRDSRQGIVKSRTSSICAELPAAHDSGCAACSAASSFS